MAAIVPIYQADPMRRISRLDIALFVAASLLLGCSRQPYSAGSSVNRASGVADEEKLPFEEPPDGHGISPSSSLVPAAQSVPPGTPLTIRLESSISSATARSGESFQAVLEEPILMQGRSVVPAGTSVTGTVVELNRSASLHRPAYVRLELTSIDVNGYPIPIETSSIFAKAGLQQGAKSTSADAENGTTASPTGRSITGQKKAQFGVNRRLVFRLTSAISLPK